MIVRVEAQTRVLIARHAEDLHGEMLEREHYFRFVGNQRVDILTRKTHYQIGGFERVMSGLTVCDFKLYLQTGKGQNPMQKLFYLRPGFGNGIFDIAHVISRHYFRFLGTGLTSMTVGAGGAGIILFVTYCDKIPTKLPVSQYNTNPDAWK